MFPQLGLLGAWHGFWRRTADRDEQGLTSPSHGGDPVRSIEALLTGLDSAGITSDPVFRPTGRRLHLARRPHALQCLADREDPRRMCRPRPGAVRRALAKIRLSHQRGGDASVCKVMEISQRMSVDTLRKARPAQKASIPIPARSPHPEPRLVGRHGKGPDRAPCHCIPHYPIGLLLRCHTG
jgi:hypothetical protein